MTDRESLIIEQIPHLRRYATALLRDREKADDLVQDCLSRAMSRLSFWKSTGSMKAWLFTILHHQFLNQLRRQRLESEIFTDAGDKEHQSQAPNQVPKVELSEVSVAMRLLSDEHKSVILLAGLEGYSYAEIAKITGLPIGTVMSRLARGRDKLRQLVDAGPVSNLRRVK